MVPVKVNPEEIEKLKKIIEEQIKAINLLEERTAKYGMLDAPLKLQEELATREMEVERTKQILELKQLADKRAIEIHQVKLGLEIERQRRMLNVSISLVLAFIGIIIGVVVNLISDSLTNLFSINIDLGVLLGVALGLISIIATIWSLSIYREQQDKKAISKIVNNQKVIVDKDTNNSATAAKGEI